VVGLGQAASATIDGCDISDTAATSAGDAEGGVMHIGASATATLIGGSISNAVVTSISGSARGGVMRLSDNADVSITGCRITNVTATALNHARGGCLMLDNAAVLRLVGTRLERCAAQSEASNGEGGAAYVSSDAQLIMSSGTLLLDNAASASGHTIKVIAASAVYVLPALPGRWVSGSRCEVRRYPCASAPQCSAEQRCSLLNGTQPPAPDMDGVWCPLRQPERFQRCNYNNPQLLGQTIETLPEGAVDDDYPYACTVAGFVERLPPSPWTPSFHSDQHPPIELS
jgi:hypothetical protein